MKTLIFDLDGTLLKSYNSIFTKKFINVLKKLQRSGEFKLYFITGRNSKCTRPLIDQLCHAYDLDCHFIMNNGALEFYTASYINKDKLIDFLRANIQYLDFAQVEYNDNYQISYNIDDKTTLKKICKKSNGEIAGLFKLMDVIETERILKVYLGFTNKVEIPKELQITDYGDNVYDILPDNCSKKNVALKYIDDLNNTYFFADGLNDLELFKIVPNRYCPTNAHPELLKICTKTYDSSNLQEGVIKIIREIAKSN